MSISDITVAEFELTPMRVSFKGVGEAGFTDLGGTFGNVAVAISYKKAALKADQAGTEPIDHKVSGLEVKVTTTLAEVQGKDKWKVAFPHATLVEKTLTGASITVASPGVVTKVAHGLLAGDAIKFTAGTLPTGLSLNTTYYVLSSGLTADDFQVALTAGGTAIVTTGSAGSGVTIVGVSNNLLAIDLFTNLGDSGQAKAGELLLHPLSKGDADKATDYTFYKACSMAATEVTYGPDAQVGLKVEWFIYPDMDNSQKYMRYGDADLV